MGIEPTSPDGLKEAVFPAGGTIGDVDLELVAVIPVMLVVIPLSYSKEINGNVDRTISRHQCWWKQHFADGEAQE